MDGFFGKCLNGAADIVIAFAFFVFLMERRSEKPLPLILTILAGTVCEFFFLPPGDDMTLLFMISVLIAGSFIVFEEKPSMIVCCSLAAAYVYCISDLIFGNLAVLMTGKTFFALLNPEGITRFIIRNCSALLLIPMCFIIKKSKEFISENARWILNWIIFAFGFASMILLRNCDSGMDDINGTDALLAAAGFAAIYAVSPAVMYLFSVICERYQRRKRTQLSEKSYDQFREQVILQKENTLALNKFRHDIVNHLIDIRALIVANDTDSALALLDETARKAEEAWAEPLSTGDPIADVVIASKSAVCRSKGIEFICKTESMDDFQMDLVDMSSLISNLLDNAIEAAEKTESPYVKLDIFDHNAYHVIRVENKMSEKPAALGGNSLQTKKSEADLHGFGLKIIQDIAEKYGGNFVRKEDGDRFIATVLIKIHLKNGVKYDVD